MLATDDKGYRYRFTVIFSVYKAEKYIDEAVASILHQSIGFEQNVQLVLVDDGSPDRCGEICDGYAAKYPQNIRVIHKENGGPSSARMAGLQVAEGRYVNFCDPDDILSDNALESVYRFFDRYDDVTDIVSIPMILFGTAHGKHHLNTKFDKGTRIINVEKEYYYPQLSVATSFLKNEVAKQLQFSSKLVTAEDAEQITKILIRKPYLGVVADCVYYYRRYGESLVAAGPKKAAWYNDYLRYFCLEVMDYAERERGYIPKFVQYTVFCDMQWKFKIPEAPTVLSAEERAEYGRLLDLCLSKISDEVILKLPGLYWDLRIALLHGKHPEESLVIKSPIDLYLGRDGELLHQYSNTAIRLSFLDREKNGFRLSVRHVVFDLYDKPDTTELYCNGKRFLPEKITFTDNVKSIGKTVSRWFSCEYFLPDEALTEAENRCTFVTSVSGARVEHKHVSADANFPLESGYKKAYCYRDGYTFTLDPSALLIRKATNADRRKAERAFRRELWRSDRNGERKAVLARILLGVYRAFHKKPVWIISDRLNKCGDNGEAFFRYLKQIKYKKVRYYYAIRKCPGYDQMRPLGNVVDRDSWKYKFLHLAAECIISSHGDDFVTNPFDNYSAPYKDILRQKNFIFLQHGVTQNDISGWLNRYNKNIRGFICAANPEYRSILDTPSYFYTEREAWLTGFARFDRLYHDEKKYITVMPTWRRYLMSGFDNEAGIWLGSEQFTSSRYYQFYNALINDERLLSAAKEYGYTVCYMPHPNVITFKDVFHQAEGVRFFTIDDEYRDVYAQSDLVLTDYSSAVFDFAYLRKPVVYAQFDKEEFFDGGHVCVAGYFDYERDGFGEVTYDLDSTVAVLIDYMKNGCQMKPEYRERADRFFAFNDRDNCKRILAKIEEAENREEK